MVAQSLPQREQLRVSPSQNYAIKDFHEVFLTLFLPLPHNRFCFRRGLRCGGEGRGEGVVTGPLTLALSPATRRFDCLRRQRGRGTKRVFTQRQMSPSHSRQAGSLSHEPEHAIPDTSSAEMLVPRGPDRQWQDRCRHRTGRSHWRGDRLPRFDDDLSRDGHWNRQAFAGRASAGATPLARHARPARGVLDC